MKFLYNEEKIRELLGAVSALTGISMAFLDPENHFLCSTARKDDFCSRFQETGNNLEKCTCADAEILTKSQKSGRYECHICHAGLYDAAIPLVKSGILAGSVIMGRVRAEASPETPHLTDDPQLRALYRQIPCFTNGQLESLRILLPNILFESAISLMQDPIMDQMEEYIGGNLSSDLSVQFLCRYFHISKNLLYRRFHKRYGCTVNEYVTDRRIAYAKELLLQTDEPMYLVADKTGLGCDTYFQKIFKKKTGMTPVAYRKRG